jgi:hypothetical protein
MLAGRGFATAVFLIVIALTCIAFAKRLERERRLLRKLREGNGTVSSETLTEDERDTAESLAHVGVLRKDRNRYMHAEGLATFKSKRLRLALSGAAAALLLAILIAFILLR